jgi:hypothetical protein
MAKKLAIKEGHVLALLDAPAGWAVPDLPDAVEVRTDLRRAPDTTIAFVRSQTELARQAPRLVKATRPTAGLWIAWPRKAGGHVSDMSEQSLRDTFLPTGLVDVKVAAIDDDWSGLRFVWRKARH